MKFFKFPRVFSCFVFGIFSLAIFVPTFSFPSRVVASTPDLAECSHFNAQDTAVVGEVFPVQASMSNTGTNTCVNNGTKPYKLSSEILSDNMTWGLSRVNMVPASVAPGETAIFNFNVTAPSVPGVYTLAFGMVHEFVAHMPNVCQK